MSYAISFAPACARKSISAEWTTRGQGQRPAYGCSVRSEPSSISMSAMSRRALRLRGLRQTPVERLQLHGLQRAGARRAEARERDVRRQHEDCCRRADEQACEELPHGSLL
jgi:hypothetical protein